MVVPVELQDREVASPKCHIFSLSSLGMPWEKTMFTIALAQGFSRQGYRVLIVDLDFEVPLLTASLIEADVDLSSIIFSNDWYLGEEAFPIEELLQRLVSIGPNLLFPIRIMPSSPDAKKIKATQEMDAKSTKKSLRKITRFFRELQKEEMFDIILVNVPFLTSHTINGMMTADYNFVLLDHNSMAFHLFQQHVDALVGIYPTLNIAGLILHRFQSSAAPENDAVTTALVEEQLRYPVVVKLPSLRDRLFTRPDESLWSAQDQQLQDFFESIALNFAAFTQSPRRVEKKKPKLIYYQLYITHASGLPLLRYTFEKEEVDGAIASAGLSSIIDGTETMISELIGDRRDSMKIIELKNVKLIIEQYGGVKALLLANLYDETTRRRLKALLRHFVQKHSIEVKNFMGDLEPFDDAHLLVEEHFLQKTPVEEEPALPLFLIGGIGKSRAWELQKLGITSVNDLINVESTRAELIASELNVGTNVIDNWIIQGKHLLKEN